MAPHRLFVWVAVLLSALFSCAPAGEGTTPTGPSPEVVETSTFEGMRDLVPGGGGPAWRRSLGPSPRDLLGPVGLLAPAAVFDVLGGPADSSWAVRVEPPLDCEAIHRLDEVGAVAAVSLSPSWMAAQLRCPSQEASEEGGLPSAVESGAAAGARLWLAFVDALPPDQMGQRCAWEGLYTASERLRRLGRQSHRESFVAARPISSEVLPAPRLLSLPAELVLLPEPARSHLVPRALRSRSRRPLIALQSKDAGVPEEGVTSAAELAKHLALGGALWLDEPTRHELMEVLGFGRAHRGLLAAQLARVAVVLSLHDWSSRSSGSNRGLVSKLESVAASLADAGIPFEVVVLGDGRYVVDPGDPERLDRFRALLHLDASGLTDAQRGELEAYAATEGRLLLSIEGDGRTGRALRGARSVAEPQEAIPQLKSLGLGLGFTSSGRTVPGFEVVRHELPSSGSVSFHLLGDESSQEGVVVEVPEFLVPKGPLQWSFQALGQEAGRTLIPLEEAPEAGRYRLPLPSFDVWGVLVASPRPPERGPVAVRIAGASGLMVTLDVVGLEGRFPMHLAYPEAVTVGPDLDSTPSEDSVRWELSEDGKRASFKTEGEGLLLSGSLSVQGAQVQLELAANNRSQQTHEEVKAMLCLNPGRLPGFPQRFHEQTWAIDDQGPFRLAELRATGGAPLYPEVQQFRRPVVVEEALDKQRSVVFTFEGSSGVGGNAGGPGVCLHQIPSFGRMEPGDQRSLRGEVLVADGPASRALDRVKASEWPASEAYWMREFTHGDPQNGRQVLRPASCVPPPVPPELP